MKSLLSVSSELNLRLLEQIVQIMMHIALLEQPYSYVAIKVYLILSYFILSIINSYWPYMKFYPKVWSALAQAKPRDGADQTEGK